MINAIQIICNHVSAKYASIATNLHEGFHSERLQWWHIGQIPNKISTGTWRTGKYSSKYNISVFDRRLCVFDTIKVYSNIFTIILFSIRMQIERQQFEATINKLNEYFAEAEKGSCSTYWWVRTYCLKRTQFSCLFSQLNSMIQPIKINVICSEGCLACITAYLVYLCTETHYEKVNKTKHKSKATIICQMWMTKIVCFPTNISSAFERYPSILANRMNGFTIQKVYKSRTQRFVAYE